MATCTECGDELAGTRIDVRIDGVCCSLCPACDQERVMPRQPA